MRKKPVTCTRYPPGEVRSASHAMQRAAALRVRLGEWVGEARTRRAQLSAISAALDEFSAVPAVAPSKVLQLAPVSELARLAIEFNELLLAHVMSISFRVADDIVEWQVRKENRYWYLREKVLQRIMLPQGDGDSSFVLDASVLGAVSIGEGARAAGTRGKEETCKVAASATKPNSSTWSRGATLSFISRLELSGPQSRLVDMYTSSMQDENPVRCLWFNSR